MALPRLLPAIKSWSVALLMFAGLAEAQPDVGTSPWGPEDEIGRLNLITSASRQAALANLNGQRVYDLAVEYYIGMPSWQAAGDPRFQMWMTHTPRGTRVDDPLMQGEKINRHVSYTGSAFSMYAHMGTHIDALNHFGLNGKIWNHFSAEDHLGDRGWTKTGIAKYPPLVAKAVLIDIPAAKNLAELPANYRVSKQDIQQALALQNSTLHKGDIALIRTGRMRHYNHAQDFMTNPPGLGMAAARYLAEDLEVLSVGADNLSFEAFPSEVPGNYVPVHTYLLAQQGITIMELVYLEDLARDKVYEFAFIGMPLKIRGGDAAPLRPLAIPYQ